MGHKALAPASMVDIEILLHPAGGRGRGLISTGQSTCLMFYFFYSLQQFH